MILFVYSGHKMYLAQRTYAWIALIVGGVVATILTLVFSNEAYAFLAGVISIVVWVAWGVFSSWYFGLRRQVAAHMTSSTERLTYVGKDVGSSRMADVALTLEHFHEHEGGQRFGITSYLDLSSIKEGNLALQQVEWESVEAEDGRLVNIPTNTVYLLRHDGKPFAVRLVSNTRGNAYSHEDAWTTGQGNTLQLCAESLEDANNATKWLIGQTGQHSIYRGQMLQVASPQDGSTGQTIRISKRPSAQREQIVLPDSIIETLERLIRSRSKHHEQLARLGHSSKLGILLHGPPGTGKTLVTRYLIQCNKKHSVITPTDMAVETLRESFRLASYLQPSILVLEDVDLLAKARDQWTHVEGLQELMNQLDGLNPGCDALVIMTTNQPSVLEPALASRPGRISQAVEFPLPGDEHRKQLFQLYLADAISDAVPLDHWVQRTKGSSPAFLQELCKRSILLASERQDDTTAKLQVSHDDLTDAIHELVTLGGTLTAKALGFPEDMQ